MANKTQTTAKKTSSSATTSLSAAGMKGSNSTSSASSSSKKSKTLRDLLEDGLNDAYSAETQLVQALPKMAQAAENEELEEAFTKHLEQTKKHVSRLEKVYTHLGMSKGSETCEAMKGLIEEADEIISEYEQSAVRDSALIIAAQKVEHYEIAMYGSLCELADVLGYSKVCDILERTLEEEEQTDHLLTDIATDVNDEAYEMSEQEDGEEDDEDEDEE